MKVIVYLSVGGRLCNTSALSQQNRNIFDSCVLVAMNRRTSLACLLCHTKVFSFNSGASEVCFVGKHLKFVISSDLAIGQNVTH